MQPHARFRDKLYDFTGHVKNVIFASHQETIKPKRGFSRSLDQTALSVFVHREQGYFTCDSHHVIITPPPQSTFTKHK